MKIDGKSIAQMMLQSKAEPVVPEASAPVNSSGDLHSHIINCLESKDYESAIEALQKLKAK